MGLITSIQNWNKEREANNAQDIEQNYASLENAVEEYNHGLKDTAGPKITEKLKAFGILPEKNDKGEPVTWTPDETSDDRVKAIGAAIKLFNKGNHTAQDFYDTMRHAVAGDFTPKKLSESQKSGLATAQANAQGKLATGYMAGLLAPENTMEGANSRLAATGQVDPNDPYWQQAQKEMIPLIQKNQPGLISDEFLNRQFSQEVPSVAAKAIPAIETIERKGGGSSANKLAEILISGKPHKALIDNVGNVVKDFGELPGKEYKAPEPKVRTRDTREPVGWSPEQKSYVYTQRADSDGNPIKVKSGTKFMPLAEKPVPSETENSITQGLDYLDNLQRIKDRTKDIWTGPLDARVKAAKNLVQNDEEYARFTQNVGQLIKIAYVLSGKQISEKEMEMLVNKITPQLQNPDRNFMAKLDELQTMVDRGLRYKVRSLDSSGYIISPDWEPFLKKSGAMVDRGKKQEAPATVAAPAASKFKIISVQ